MASGLSGISGSTGSTALRIGQHSAKRVIFGHGLGDSPRGWAEVAASWSRLLPHVEFVLPAAPMRPVTMNGGVEMPAWYDLPTHTEINKYESRLDIEAEGIEEAVKMYSEHVLDPRSTVFAGFSQGAAVAVYTGLSAALVASAKGLQRVKYGGSSGHNDSNLFAENSQSDPHVDLKKSKSKIDDDGRVTSPFTTVPRGILCISGYLPAAQSIEGLVSSIQTTAGKNGKTMLEEYGVSPLEFLDLSIIPVMLCHGKRDPMVTIKNCDKTAEYLDSEFNIPSFVKKFPNLGHEIDAEVVQVVYEWLKERFPEDED